MTAQAGAFVSDGTKMVRATSFGQALSLVIAESKYSYHDISNNVGATKADIKRWESGDDHPTPVQLQKLFRTFPKLRHLAATFTVPGADAEAPVEADAPQASNKITGSRPADLPRVPGELGDLEVAAIEYGRAIRDQARAATRLAETRKAMAELELEARRLEDLVTRLFDELQTRAGASE